MSPESFSFVSTATSNSNQQTIRIPTPAAGANVDIASVAGGKLELDFDPGNATISRSGNDLVFEVDGGGRVTITDFFVVGDQTLPSLVLSSGDEVASAYYLANFNIDLETAAGPGAGAPGGIGRLGSPGSFYRDRATEITEEFPTGPELPFGTVDFTDSAADESPPKFTVAAHNDEISSEPANRWSSWLTI